MVNALEALYAFTAFAFLAALVLFARNRRTAARRFAIAGTFIAIVAVALYWYLTPSA